MSVPFYAPMDMDQGLGQSPPGFDNEPVPISSYHEDDQPVPINTYKEKDDFWENGLNTENKEPSPVAKENGNASADHSSFAHGTTDLNQLPPIPPVSAGQGLPYAPVDFPEPGDTWSWRVGRRVSSTGIHVDRFITLPERLQGRNIPKSFGSKPSLTRYIQANFPDADVDAFFASFSWKIPALFQPAARVDAASLFEETSKEGQNDKASGDEAAKDENAQEGKKEGNSRYSQRKRKPTQTQTYEPVEEKPKATPRTGQKKKKEKAASAPQLSSKQKSRQQPARRSSRQPGGAVDLNYMDEENETETSKTGKKRRQRGEIEEEQVSIPHIYVSPMNGVLAVSHSPVDVNPEEFDCYLDSLDNLLQQPPENGQEPSVPVITSPMREYEWAEARMKLSSLLEKDFTSLFFSKDAAELAALAAKIRKDPSLSAEEIVKLKLVEEMPSFSEVFQENKEVIEDADRFFSALELNKAKVASLKYEYSELKDKLSSLDMEVESNSETIRQIDEQIAQLQARRSELTRFIGNKKKDKADLNYAQKMVANSIPKVVQEVQSANTKKSQWEMKKENALKREAEILSKFSALKGFYL
ncbi:PREDICTED: uncharacterized protein LOC104808552 [Tarenaya hassleriana]|uniref:uncharacterized protein LOC104808552 n=1 Tax=Tarenaya hassleriana TaxID=28532 RepID=UPI00053C096D|nr:PREDICTED: uncharacterized protein LOC104808552 [Tarenaya hassleriana]